MDQIFKKLDVKVSGSPFPLSKKSPPTLEYKHTFVCVQIETDFSSKVFDNNQHGKFCKGEYHIEFSFIFISLSSNETINSTQKMVRQDFEP